MKLFYSGILGLSLFFASCSKKQTTMDPVDQVLIKDSLDMYKKLYDEAAYFSIDKNENAQKAFAPQSIENVMNKVIQDFTALNKQEDGNPLVPKDAGGNPTKINKLSVINHQWLIVDFFGEATVGELLIKYHYSPDKTTEFQVIDSVLY